MMKSKLNITNILRRGYMMPQTMGISNVKPFTPRSRNINIYNLTATSKTAEYHCWSPITHVADRRLSFSLKYLDVLVKKNVQ